MFQKTTNMQKQSYLFSLLLLASIEKLASKPSKIAEKGNEKKKGIIQKRFYIFTSNKVA